MKKILSVEATLECKLKNSKALGIKTYFLHVSLTQPQNLLPSDLPKGIFTHTETCMQIALLLSARN